MNDMEALADLGRVLDPPSAIPPDRLRRRVLTEAHSSRRLFWRPRLTLPRLAVAGGLAAALTGAVLVSQVVQFGDHAPASSASAAEILKGAVTAAQRQPVVTVRGDQFIYVDSITSATSFDESDKGSGGSVFESKQRRVWLSVDGTKDSLIQVRPKGSSGDWKSRSSAGCVDGFITQSKGSVTVKEPCTPNPNYHGDLPTDTDAMLTYLRQHGGPTKNGPDQDAFTLAGDLIREGYLAPASLSALFNAVAKIPGVTVVGDVTDDAGRTGVAVALTEVQGVRTQLIFDRQTFNYLGERSVTVRDQDGLKAGQVLESAAVLKVAVVDSAGQLP